MMEETNTARNENLIAGLVGAFLGSLLGALCIVVVGQMGYVAALSGFVMAVCSLKGYEKLGGRLSKKGVVFCSLLILVMTYFANRMDWAFSASRALEMGLLDCYRLIPLFLEDGIIESGAYWGNLALLYLFTVVGAVPTIIAALRGPSPLTGFTPDEAQAVEAEASDVTLYPANAKWCKPFLWLVGLFSAFALVACVLAAAFMGSADSSLPFWSMPTMMLLILLLMILGLYSVTPISAGRFFLYAQKNGVLWRIDPRTLNIQPGYTFSPKRGVQLIWHKLHPEEQEAAKKAVSLAIHAQEQMAPDAAARQKAFLLPLKDMQLIKSTPQYWLVRYTDPRGAVKKLKISKIYPGLPIEPDAPPLEKGPRPNVILLVTMVLCCLLPLAASLLGDSSEKKDLPGSKGESSVGSHGTTTYHNGPLTYELDSRLMETESGIYFNADTDTYYFVDPALIAGSPEDVRPLLENQLLQLQSQFEEQSSVFVSSPDTLAKLPTVNGQTYQYDCLLFTDKDNMSMLAYAVYLPQAQGIVQANALFRSESPEDVQKIMLALLSSLEVDEDAVPQAPTKVKLTEENYQTFFAPAQDMGYKYMGRSYIKAPAGMFEAGSFADAFLPYSEDATYNEDGTMMTSKAHGIELSVTLVHNEGNAADVAKELAQQVYDAKGKPLNGELMHDENLDVALWVSAHDGNGQPAPQLFYADIKQPGYYLAAVITYLPDEMDEASDELIEELSDVYSINLPSLSSLGLTESV